MNVKRFALLTVALLVGGGLGWLLLPGFNPLKMIVFVASCAILGWIFYELDKRISEK